MVRRAFPVQRAGDPENMDSENEPFCLARTNVISRNKKKKSSYVEKGGDLDSFLSLQLWAVKP